MPDPVTVSALGGLAASEGIKFLYGQAAELLKAWRERRGRVAAGEEPPAQLTVPIGASEVRDATPAVPVVDVAVLDRENAALVRLTDRLGTSAEALAELGPDGAQLA